MINDKKQLDSVLRKVFKVANSNEKVICPPDQVFVNQDFIFSLTFGAHIADNEKEYKKLMNFLKELGEEDFSIVENLGATITQRTKPFSAKLAVASTLDSFDKAVKEFDPPFGFIANHFFVFGQNPNWGIYICENPTINIIGCKADIADKFRKVFAINGNGYAKLKPFISREFSHKKEYLGQFVANYKLK